MPRRRARQDTTVTDHLRNAYLNLRDFCRWLFKRIYPSSVQESEGQDWIYVVTLPEAGNPAILGLRSIVYLYVFWTKWAMVECLSERNIYDTQAT